MAAVGATARTTVGTVGATGAWTCAGKVGRGVGVGAALKGAGVADQCGEGAAGAAARVCGGAAGAAALAAGVTGAAARTCAGVAGAAARVCGPADQAERDCCAGADRAIASVPGVDRGGAAGPWCAQDGTWCAAGEWGPGRVPVTGMDPDSDRRWASRRLRRVGGVVTGSSLCDPTTPPVLHASLICRDVVVGRAIGDPGDLRSRNHNGS
ncbi:hypothetical protein ASG23_07125 [Cellulomonas sp. Leaf395]|nr:hypothetical protein ASG23_07125 [Cellulomonas sp. Leaf395]